jgi:hypothetical protein
MERKAMPIKTILSKIGKSLNQALKEGSNMAGSSEHCQSGENEVSILILLYV